MFYSCYIDTPLGQMVAIADESALYLLEFVDSEELDRKIASLEMQLNADIVPGVTEVIFLLQKELEQYFAGTLRCFKTPIALCGTDFQNKVWRALSEIPYGSTTSYLELARMMRKPLSSRAVADALSQNRLLIIVACHRIIKSDGQLCGYSGGKSRKQWLISHENNYGA
jgi:AraC family transcriptional regulator of adaptative response/methylated-DNA-[protein]-cysteine methyltransferase